MLFRSEDLAKYLGNLPNLLANNFVESGNQMAAPGSINPATPVGGQAWAAGPTSGQFTVNGVPINWATTDSIDAILNRINTLVPNVDAVFNQSTSQFFMYSNIPIKIVNVSGNFTTWGNIANALTSTIRMSAYEAPNQPLIDPTELPVAFGGNPLASPMDSNVVGSSPNLGPNTIAFKVVPSPNGVFTINGNTFVWNSNMSLDGPNPPLAANPVGSPAPPIGIGGMINSAPATYILTPSALPLPNPNPGWAGTSSIGFVFNPATETITLTSTQNGAFSPQPIQLNDLSGNFTVFTGLNVGNATVGGLASGVSSQTASDVSTHQLLQSQASDSLAPLNAAQANIAGVSPGPASAGGPTPPGVPIATIQQQAMQSLITYNALLQVLQVIDNMYADLVGMVGGSTSPNFFQQRP